MKRILTVLAAATGLAFAGLPAVAAEPPEVFWEVWHGDPVPRQAAGMVTFDGVGLVVPGVSLAQEPVELRIREHGAATWTTHPTTTDSRGHASLTVRLRFTAEYRWYHPATAKASASDGPGGVQPVDVRVGARVNDRTLARGQRLVVSGKVFPVKPGRIIRLYAGEIADGWNPTEPAVLLSTARIAEDGSYRLVRAFRKPGPRKLFVEAPGGFRNSDGVSTYRYVRVR